MISTLAPRLVPKVTPIITPMDHTLITKPDRIQSRSDWHTDCIDCNLLTQSIVINKQYITMTIRLLVLVHTVLLIEFQEIAQTTICCFLLTARLESLATSHQSTTTLKDWQFGICH